VITINLAPIFHRFRDIAFDGSKIAMFGYTSFVFIPLRRGSSPGTIYVNFFIERSEMAKVPNGVEIFRKISIAWVVRTNVTDRRQPDGERERELYHVLKKDWSWY